MQMQRNLGKRIRELRQKKGLTQTQLARSCGLWPDHIGKIERGNSNVRLSSLVKISRKLGTTIARLLDGIL